MQFSFLAMHRGKKWIMLLPPEALPGLRRRAELPLTGKEQRANNENILNALSRGSQVKYFNVSA